MSNENPNPVPPQGAPNPNPPQAQPQPPQQPRKSGVHPLVWVGVGCAGLIVLLVGGCIVLAIFAKGTADKMAKDEDFRNKVMGKVTGTEISRDEKTGEMVVRDKDTGEEVAFDTDAKDGTSGITLRDPKTGEESSFKASKTIPEDFPKAVPVYENTEIATSARTETPNGTSFHVTLQSDDDMATIADFYRKALKDAGYELAVDHTSGGTKTTLSFRREDNRNAVVNVGITARDQDGSTISLHVREPKVKAD